MASRGERIAPPSNIAAIAESLARIGWPVFPVSIYRDEAGKRHKVPAVPKGTSWVEWATTDVAKVRAAWAGEHAGRSWVGVYAGGAGIVVLDTDTDPKDASVDLGARSLQQAGLKPPKTFAYPTLGGGIHRIYKAPAGALLTNAQGLMHDGARLEHVDVRGGRGLMVYYGPELTEPPTLADAPDWVLVTGTPKEADRSPRASEAEFRSRLVAGKPDDAVQHALSQVRSQGMSHTDMLEAVTELVQLGKNGHRGVGEALDTARERYADGYPDAHRHWDNAVTGSIRRLGLPMATIELTKDERKTIANRNSPAAIRQAKKEKWDALPAEKKADIVGTRVEHGEGELTDAVLAETIAAEFTGSWANASGIGILRYDGKVWTPASEEALFEAVRKAIRRIRADETRAAILRGDKKHEDSARQLEGRSRIVNIARFAAGILAETTPAIDSHPDLLNCPNGVVDLRTGELRPHDPALMFTKITAAEYDPTADATLWKKALESLPKSSRKWMQVRLGQALTGHTPDDAIMPIMRGGGENGKSLLFDAVRSAAGSFAVTVSKRLLTANPGDHPTELTDLMGARIAFAEELPEGRTLDVGRLKDTVGTSTLTARRMRQDNVTWKATHGIFVNTNYEVAVNETDHGTWRRLALVVFPYRFRKPGEPLVAKNDRRGDPRLRHYFEGNADPSVLAWLVKGARTWYKAGKMMPSMPDRIRADTDSWRSDADPVLGYVAERLELADGYAISTTDLTADFNAYLEQRAQKPWGEGTIASRFKDHVSLPGVVRAQVRFGSVKASRPEATFLARGLPASAKALVGVRFRPVEERIKSEAEMDAETLGAMERGLGS